MIKKSPPNSDTELRSKWDAALADYLAKRAISDALPIDAAGGDAAIDAYCEALDHLAEMVRAPDVKALARKIELAKERWQDFVMPAEWLDGLLADARHLAAGGR